MRAYNLGEQMTDEDSLAHYGVKGMKWGRRKTDGGGSPKVSRKQNRQMNREASQKFYADKASKIYSEGKKQGDRILIKTRFPGDNIPTITTGKEFSSYLERGGALDIRATEIFARQPAKGGQFVENDAPIGSYQKQNFRRP